MSTESPRSEESRGPLRRLQRSRPEDRLPADDAEKSVSDTFAPPVEDQINIAELQRMSMKDLIAIAERDQLTEYH
ncbi:MAG: hypothetical protein ACKON9_22555, partial [Planctomycetaceae bacterium]